MAGMTAASWRDGLLALLPPSQALNRQPGGVLYRVLEALGAALSQAQLRAMSLVAQFDPLQADELLADWERLYGLPDPCLDESEDLAQRRLRVNGRRLLLGAQSPKYFADMVKALGYPNARVQEFRPMKVDSKCTAPINQGGWRFAFRVHVMKVANIIQATAMSKCTAALRSWGDPGLTCLLRRYKPAHTVVLIGWIDPADCLILSDGSPLLVIDDEFLFME